MMHETVTCRQHDGIAVVLIDNPPINAAGHAVRQGLLDAVARARADAGVKAIVIAAAGRTFIAGADIREFGKPRQPPDLPAVIDAIEDSEVPVIVVLHGTTLGGGLEVALGAHYRIALAGTRLGLPEVKLGLLPGAGGTQRLPRLTGARVALELITSGRFIDAREALKLGVIDEIVDGEPEAAGLAWARRAIDQALAVRRVRDLDARIAGDRDNAALFENFRRRLEGEARGLFSPFRCVDAVQAAVELPFAEGQAKERELFVQCMASPQREGLVHAFFAEREVVKVPEARAEPRPVESIAVVGGGTMGVGIAVSALYAGVRVILLERGAEALQSAREQVARTLEGGVRRGKLSAADKADILATRFATTLDYADLAPVDLAIEAVFEDLDIKRGVFAQLDGVLRPGAVLATNTSYLDVDEIAAATSRAQDVIGLHFFSPAHVMKLLEVVVAARTEPAVVATGFALARRLGKVAVRAGVCDGFIGNRLLASYRRQADYMVEDGASPYAVDAALREFGYPMGPYQVSDLAGLDISWAMRKRLAPQRDPNERYVAIADRLCERGWFGRKTGRGFYRYDEDSKIGQPDPEVEAIIAAERSARGVSAREFGAGEIVRRYLAAMINEAARVLEEGIALRPLDVDVTLLYGYGFPRWRGGPLKFADMHGPDRVLEDIRGFAAADERFWRPAQLLVDLVARGDDFDSLNQAYRARADGGAPDVGD